MIYFIEFNGITVVRQYNYAFMYQYVSDSQIVSQTYQSQALITTVVSILSIFIVMLVISPVISKTEEQRYLSLAFFLKTPQLTIK